MSPLTTRQMELCTILDQILCVFTLPRLKLTPKCTFEILYGRSMWIRQFRFGPYYAAWNVCPIVLPHVETNGRLMCVSVLCCTGDAVFLHWSSKVPSDVSVEKALPALSLVRKSSLVVLKYTSYPSRLLLSLLMLMAGTARTMWPFCRICWKD